MAEPENPQRAKQDPWSYFTFGLSVERRVQEEIKPGETRLRKSLEVLIDVASGELTLWDTPEETAQALLTEKQFPIDDLPEILRDARHSERQIARELLSFLDINFDDEG